MRIEFTIPGPPVPKARPRVTKSGFAYTPKRTAVYEMAVKLIFNSKYKEQLHGPVGARIEAYFKIPKADRKVKENDYCTKHLGDSDNIGKAILDALNGLAYEDDAQVVELWIEKRYSITPRVEVVLTELEG